MTFTVNELIAGRCWVENNFPDADEIDLAYLISRFGMPKYAAEYVRKHWILNTTIIKPFKNSEIYSKSSSSSSSSLYTV